MKKLMLSAGAVLVALVLAGPAAAKEMTLLQVCGADGCKALKSGALPAHDGGLLSTTAPPPQSYYVLKVGVGDGKQIVEHFEMYYVPGIGAVMGKTSGVEGWSRFPRSVVARIDRTAKGLKPFKRPTVRSAYVNEHRSLDAAPYADLLGPLDRTEIPSTSESPIPVALNWGELGPWSRDGSLLSYLVRSKVVIRTDGYFRVPDSLAQRLEREGQGLAPVVPGNGFPWQILVGALGGAAALGAAAIVLVRKRRPRAAEGAAPA